MTSAVAVHNLVVKIVKGVVVAKLPKVPADVGNAASLKVM